MFSSKEIDLAILCVSAFGKLSLGGVFGLFVFALFLNQLFNRRNLILAAHYVYLVELFPTTLRGIGLGFVNIVGRMGIAVAPLVNSIAIGKK